MIVAYGHDCPTSINTPEEAAAALRSLEQSKFFSTSTPSKRFPGNQPTQYVLLRSFIAVNTSGTVADTSADILGKLQCNSTPGFFDT
jgi:hypothetical protein